MYGVWEEEKEREESMFIRTYVRVHRGSFVIGGGEKLGRIGWARERKEWAGE